MPINATGCRDTIHSRSERAHRHTEDLCVRLLIRLVPVGSSWASNYAAASDSILVELVRVEYLFPAEHEVDRARQFGREDGQGLALAVLFLEPLMQLLRLGVDPQERGGQFPERPLQMRVADLFAGMAVELTGRLAFGLDQTAVGQEILDSGKAADVVHLIEDD